MFVNNIMKVTKETPNEVWVKGETRILKYWKHGIGFIPLHANPKISEDLETRFFLKWRQRRMTA